MEAANLGAYLSKYVDRGALDRALTILKQAPAYESDHARYIEATRKVLADLPSGGASLGVPTWIYPDEPVNLFSSHIAKYFSNSMREEGLIAIGSHGVIIASDTPGTVREVFQAAEQDSYWVGDHRSPMVLLGPQGSSSFALLIAYARQVVRGSGGGRQLHRPHASSQSALAHPDKDRRWTAAHALSPIRLISGWTNRAWR